MATPSATVPTFVLTLEVAPADADALNEWLTRDLKLPVVELARPGHARVWLEIYFTSDIEAALIQTMAAARGSIQASHIRSLQPRDWIAFGRDHFHAQAIGARLWICPSWEKDRAIPPGRVPVYIDPGLSFGTGDHFTTRFCLEMIDQLCQKAAPISLLDVGTGSGILVIAAARLGCHRVLALDNDPQAVAHARDNAQMNEIGNQIEWQVMDITNDTPRESFDVVSANLYSQVLIDTAPTLTRCAVRRLILSGLREAELDPVAETYLARGARELVRDGDGEWGGIMLATDHA